MLTCMSMKGLILYHSSWLVGFGFNGPLRQYFSLYRAVSQREGERGKKGYVRKKRTKTTPTRTDCYRSRPLSNYNPNCRTPRHWKLTQHHRTTRPPLYHSSLVRFPVINYGSWSFVISGARRFCCSCIFHCW